LILSDTTILDYLRSGKILIEPEVRETDVRPTGVRIHLAEEILVPKANVLVNPEAMVDVPYRSIRLGPEGHILRTQEFVLGSSRERIKTDREIVCLLDGRSTIARLGLGIHCTAGLMDSVHDDMRSVTLELYNFGPFDLLLTPGMAIGIVVFSTLSAPIAQNAQVQYFGQVGATRPNLHFRRK